ncbi:MAG: hypothetical protein ACREJ3_08410 [Polyangiaceae bacterium]
MTNMRADFLLAIVASMTSLATACGGKDSTRGGGPALDSGASTVDASVFVKAGAGADAAALPMDSGLLSRDTGADSTNGASPGCTLDASTIPGDAMTCPIGSVVFRMSVPPGSQISLPGAECNWLSVSCESGKPLDTSIRASANLDCRDCASSSPIAYGCFLTLAGDGGQSTFDQAWNGRYYTVGTCGSVPIPYNQCSLPQCAPAGTYVATMCGCTPADSGSECKQACVTVPFDYPTNETVIGTLP